MPEDLIVAFPNPAPLPTSATEPPLRLCQPSILPSLPTVVAADDDEERTRPG